MFLNRIQNSVFLLLSALLISCYTPKKEVAIHFNPGSSVLKYGVDKLEQQLIKNDLAIGHKGEKKIFIVRPQDSIGQSQNQISKEQFAKIEAGGYQILRSKSNIYIFGKDDSGCLYGIMDLIQQLRARTGLSDIRNKHINPSLSFRAIKFNLPWSPYRPGPATDLHIETCRDLDFWESFLDMMVKNRFNALTLWNTHPFPYMIRAANYPEATPLNDQELEEWKSFWKVLFKMAKTRGIETYIVNWNIVVSPEFATAYGAKIHFDRSELVKKYTRESVTQTINEYEDLTGIGVTLADWMGNWGEEKMSPREREDWIQETIVDGMKAADREVKFIHRAVLAGDPKEMRKVIDYADLPDNTIVEVKFNWSHGHSTPHLSLTHSNDAGTIMRDFWDPMPENYFISWMIRNEDFFVLRWGDPDFIRSHISTNHHDYVDGYFIGSEGYIPAVDYSHKETPAKTWKYAFQKQWMYYYLWGNLLYDPQMDNSEIALKIYQKYPDVNALKLLEAYALASKVPQSIASFYKGTWDFTLYSEGFLAPWQNGFDDGKSPFISLVELIKHETLDKRYMNIEAYCDAIQSQGKVAEAIITPIELADSLFDNGKQLEKLISEISDSTEDETLNSELDDLFTWCHLGYYFSHKLKAGVDFTNYNFSKDEKEKLNSVAHLEQCIDHWKKIIELTEDRYDPMPYVSMGHHEQKWLDFKEFHWKNFLFDVEADLKFVLNSN